jgi:hypothetical protein
VDEGDLEFELGMKGLSWRKGKLDSAGPGHKRKCTCHGCKSL